MKILYIAGPYRGADYLAIERNIAKAREAAAWLARNGIGFVCPHLNSAHFEAITPEVDEDFWLTMDMHLLFDCDGLLLIDGWQGSTGALAEKSVAEEQNKPVFEWRVSGEETARLMQWATS